MLQSYKPGVGNLQLPGRIRPATLIQTVATVRPIVNLPPPLATSCIAYLWGTTYEKLYCAINVLYVVFTAFVMNCENQELI